MIDFLKFYNICRDNKYIKTDSIKVLYNEYVNHYNGIKELKFCIVNEECLKNILLNFEDRKDWWNSLIKLDNEVVNWDNENNFGLSTCKEYYFDLNSIRFVISKAEDKKTNKEDCHYYFYLNLGFMHWYSTSVLNEFHICINKGNNTGFDSMWTEEDKNFKKYLNKCKRYMKLKYC